MKRLLLIGVCLICWAITTSIKAAEPEGFSHRITGTAISVNDEVIDIDMLIGFHKSTQGWYFRIGPDYIFRDTPPSAYYLNLNLNREGSAYVTDFSEQPLKGFLIEIEDYEIELLPARSSDIEHSLRLRINDRQFLFDTSHPRLRFELTDTGLSTISAEGTLRDLSIQRAQ